MADPLEQDVEAPAAEQQAPPVAQDAVPSESPPPMQVADNSGQPAQDMAQAPAPKAGAPLPEEDNLQRHLDAIAFSKDLEGGAIKPETYHSLYEKKDTLGKVGTLFGLLVSGAGSGLTGQPNALLAMMDKQIQNDLESQKTTQSNKANWYTSAMHQEKNASDINYQNALAASTRMGTQGQSFKNDLDRWKNTTIPGLNDLSASTTASNAMQMTYVQELQNYVNRLAPGPAKEQAQSTLDNVVRPYVSNQITNNINTLHQKKKTIEAISPNPLLKVTTPQTSDQPIDPRGPVVDENLLQQKVNLGRTAPGTIGSLSDAQQQDVIGLKSRIATNRGNLADYAENFDKINNLALAGQVPGVSTARSLLTAAGTGIGSAAGLLGAGVGTSIGNTIGHAGEDLQSIFERDRKQQYNNIVQHLGNNMNADEKKELANSILPQWNDSEEKVKEAFEKGKQHFRTQEVGDLNALKTYNIGAVPFPEIKYKNSVSKGTNEKKKKLPPQIEDPDSTE